MYVSGLQKKKGVSIFINFKLIVGFRSFGSIYEMKRTVGIFLFHLFSGHG